MTMKRLAGPLVVLAALLAHAPSPAGAQCCYPQHPEAIEVSDDGRNVYVVADVIQVLRRDPVTGGLELIDLEYVGGRRGELSPDQRHLYVGDRILARDPVTGALTESGNPAREGEGYAASPLEYGDYVAFGSDRTLYAADGDDGLLKILDRDPRSGQLTLRRQLSIGYGVRRLGEIAISPDGRWLYVTGTAPAGEIGAFRVLEDGDLQAAPEANCDCRGDWQIEMAPDGRRIALGPVGFIATIERDEGGAIHGRGSDSGFSQPENFVFTPDGASLLAVNRHSNALEQYDNEPDGLRKRRDYSISDGVEAPSAVAVSPDGRHVYVGGGNQPAAPSTVSVFERGLDGQLSRSSVYASPLATGRPFGGPPPSVSINDGAPYTNDPKVQLTFEGLGRRDHTIELSNDGSFRRSESRDFVVGAVHPWTLASTGPERLPKTVYVRVHGGSGNETLTDDIVLDETPPVVLFARRAGGKVKVKARDRLSGVSHVQVTRNPRKPGSWRRFKSRTALPGGRGTIRVRVRDRARNRSSWAVAR